jgi:hypothetical protein
MLDRPRTAHDREMVAFDENSHPTQRPEFGKLIPDIAG